MGKGWPMKKPKTGKPGRRGSSKGGTLGAPERMRGAYPKRIPGMRDKLSDLMIVDYVTGPKGEKA